MAQIAIVIEKREKLSNESGEKLGVAVGQQNFLTSS